MLQGTSLRNLVTGLSLAAAMTVAASSASALTVSVVGGTSGTVPGATGINDGVGPIYGSAQSPVGVYGANIFIDAPAAITAVLLGSEAGYTNTFKFAGGPSLVGGNTTGTGLWNVGTTINFVQAASGLVTFSFLTTGPGVGVTNGTNPAPLSGSPNFFVVKVGNFYDLWFDDAGAGPDDNHDDLAIRLSFAEIPGGPGDTPLPAAGYLFLSGIGGYGFLRMRQKKAAKKAA